MTNEEIAEAILDCFRNAPVERPGGPRLSPELAATVARRLIDSAVKEAVTKERERIIAECCENCKRKLASALVRELLGVTVNRGPSIQLDPQPTPGNETIEVDKSWFSWAMSVL